MTPEIFHCVADFVGDSLQLAREAAKTDAKVIVQAGVHFMAETAKVLNPHRIVTLPDIHAGCSLVDSCPVEGVRAFRHKHPHHVIVSYINTSVRPLGGRDPSRRIPVPSITFTKRRI